jgi:hypothetical protein
MKRFLITAAVLSSILAGADADQLHSYWRDAIRPHGHKRSDAVFNANVSTCNDRAGVQSDSVSLAYRECMQSFGYRFVSARIEHTPAPKRDRSVVTYNRDSPDPDVGWHTDANGFRQCQHDCDNPQIPGSGYTCRSVEFMGRAMTQCDK